MDETQISITIKPMYIERLIYWIIIIALAVLLALSYLKEDATATPVKTTTDTVTDTATPTPEPTDTAPITTVEPDDTCTDAKKSGDESDIDCGGSCGVKCASGKACSNNSDCVSNICTSNLCTNTAPTTLSGKLELDVTQAIFTKTTTNAVKVTGMSYKVTNGLGTDLTGAQIHVYLKNKNGARCLNQGVSTSCDIVFATIALPRVAPGKNTGETHTFTKEEYSSGSFVQAGDYYVNGEEFNVVAYLVDSKGEDIGGKTLSDSVAVKP